MRRAGGGATWGPTQLEDKFDWERPLIHERWQGDLVERVGRMGVRAQERDTRLRYKLRPVEKGNAWKQAHRMGVELFTLAKKFRAV